MAIAYDASSGGHTATTTNLTWSHTCTGTNRILFVGYRCSVSGAVSGITYNGVAMTFIAQGGDNSSSYLGLWYLINPATGSNTVSITLSSAFISGISASYTGAKQSSQPDSSNTRTASGTTSGNISTTIVVNNSWTVAISKAASSAITGGVNSTNRAQGDNNEMQFSDSNGDLSAGSKTMNMTSGANAFWGQVIASFSPPAAGGSWFMFI